jgi:hypothetical protein
MYRTAIPGIARTSWRLDGGTDPWKGTDADQGGYPAFLGSSRWRFAWPLELNVPSIQLRTF